ncbi:hypothetical protein chiPu_0006822 [Chiloscyllium punctatum]|uniref:Uncharacterized protein n=1 Tax=Chiloscyllium punctatum TaxID=137246 RepID=A0A401SD95_CHIPU|nr:hypothetical protein [Chiloscyllium punctatum]
MEVQSVAPGIVGLLLRRDIGDGPYPNMLWDLERNLANGDWEQALPKCVWDPAKDPVSTVCEWTLPKRVPESSEGSSNRTLHQHIPEFDNG